MSKIHHWLIVRGQASIWVESSKIMLELDPQGSPYCILSIQDAEEIAEIITNEACTLWDASDKKSSSTPKVEGDVQHSCKLWVESEYLQLAIHNLQPLIALINDSGKRVELDVSCAVALVQILQHMSDAIEQRA